MFTPKKGKSKKKERGSKFFFFSIFRTLLTLDRFSKCFFFSTSHHHLRRSSPASLRTLQRRHAMRVHASPICGGSAPPLPRRAATARAAMTIPAATMLTTSLERPRPPLFPTTAPALPQRWRGSSQSTSIPRATASSSSSDDADSPLMKKKARNYVNATV